MSGMIFFGGETPNGWGLPGIRGRFASSTAAQSGVCLIRRQGENRLIDSSYCLKDCVLSGVGSADGC